MNHLPATGPTSSSSVQNPKSTEEYDRMELSIRSLAFASICALLAACADDRGTTSESDSASTADVVPVTLDNYKTEE